MEEDGLLETYWGDGVGGARRRYYRITEKGKALYADKAEEWKKASRILDKLILGERK